MVARTGEGELPMRPEPLDVRELLERVRRRFADRARRARTRDPRRRRRRAAAVRGRAAPGPGARQPGRQRAALRRGRDRAALRAARTAARSSRSPTRARASRPTSPTRLRALRARRPRPHARRHRASASRSCGRSRRRTAAGPRSCRAPARRCESGCPTRADRCRSLLLVALHRARVAHLRACPGSAPASRRARRWRSRSQQRSSSTSTERRRSRSPSRASSSAASACSRLRSSCSSRDQPFDPGRDALVAHARDPTLVTIARSAPRSHSPPCSPRPGGARRGAVAAPALRAGAGQRRHHAADRLSDARLGPRRRARPRPAHPPVRPRARAPARLAPAGARRRGPEHDRRAAWSSRPPAGAGFDPRDVIVSASHTHAGPTGYSNFLFKDAPSRRPTGARLRRDASPTRCSTRSSCSGSRWRSSAPAPTSRPRPPAGAARDADRPDGEPVARGAPRRPRHRASARGDGRAEQDPDGAAHTIDPNVDVLRVDRLAGGRRVPLGRLVDVRQPRHRQPLDLRLLQRRPPRRRRARLRGGACAAPATCRAGRPVVNVYGNSDAGDVSAGLTRFGPAVAEQVGRREARGDAGAPGAAPARA